jgi:hypothetical protein
MEIELTMLYNQAGEKAKAAEMIDDAYKRLEDPTCIRTRTTEGMLNYIKSYRDNPQYANIKPFPQIYRYISLVILLIGYAVIYALDDFLNFSSDDFFILIIGVFVFSMLISSVLNANYKSYVRRTLASGTVNASSTSTSEDQSGAPTLQSGSQSNPRLLNDADKQLSSASAYLRKKDYTSAQSKIMEANNILNDPSCPPGMTKDALIQKSKELEKQIQDDQSGFGSS